MPTSPSPVSFDNSYARLPERFYARVEAARFEAPSLIAFNAKLAEELGLDLASASEETLARIFSGQELLPGSEPIAMAYAGHQFGGFVPQLGDGRAMLLGEVVDKNGVRREIQLKGSGQTPFSRGADGRAAVGPVIREYIVSEAMQALRVKTTRSLAAVATGEPVFRETPLPGAVLTRVAQSHIRIGTFQYFAVREDMEAVKMLADYVIDRLYPEVKRTKEPYAALFEAVMEAQAKLVAQWMHLGFIHGVMNTDNMALSGETIDYGPCAFMDVYHPATVFSSIDLNGRYAYGNQPAIAQWNLTRFAECLLPLLNKNMDKAIAQAEEMLMRFGEVFTKHWLTGMNRKLGLLTEVEDDLKLAEQLLLAMEKVAADYTLTFRELPMILENPEQAKQDIFRSDELREWILQWKKRLEREKRPTSEVAAGMREVNPLYIPRNDHVEAAIAAAVKHGDFSQMQRLLEVLEKPYLEQPGAEAFASALPGEKTPYRTFCGT